MNRPNQTYCQAISNATFSGTFAGFVSTDEEKARGFFDSKSLRKQICRTLLASNTPIASSGFLDSKALRKSLFSGFVFTGKERDEETGYGYFGARYMDHELMTMWLSVDPMADKYPSISPYAYCAWNPIKLVDPNGEEISDHIDENGYLIAHYDDGDDGVYVHANGTTKTQIDNQREVLGNTGGFGLYIGDLGGEIDVSSVMENKLQESSTIAQTFRGNSKYSLYYDKVHTGGDWDLKNNEKTIWGVAWKYDNTNGTQTTFSCNRFSNASAADVGNYHAGYTGIMAGIGKYMLCKGAGLAETVKSFRNWRIFDGLYRANSLLTPLNLRSGDRKRDYIFNTMGMGDAKKELR